MEFTRSESENNSLLESFNKTFQSLMARNMENDAEKPASLCMKKTTKQLLIPASSSTNSPRRPPHAVSASNDIFDLYGEYMKRESPFVPEAADAPIKIKLPANARITSY